MDKGQLRLAVKTARLQMSKEEIALKSGAICTRLIDSMDWTQISSLHTYSPIKKLNEVDTASLVDYLKTNYPRIKLSVQDQSVKSNMPNEKFDLIIVPTLAFDKKRNRLGWGGGWYDQFLAAQLQARKIGLCFENGLVEHILAERHDVSLDAIVTEQRIIEQ